MATELQKLDWDQQFEELKLLVGGEEALSQMIAKIAAESDEMELEIDPVTGEERIKLVEN